MSDKPKRQFVISPIRALTDKRLTPYAHQILCLVCSYCDKNGITWVSQKSLSEVMEVSRPAITKQITNLRNLGYIEIIKKGYRNNHSNTIRVIFDEHQPIVDQLEVDDVKQKGKVLEMINKAFNRPAQLDAAKPIKRDESPTVKAMKEHIQRVKNKGLLVTPELPKTNSS
jgi:DNA-binding transcriptional MocR family regulator